MQCYQFIHYCAFFNANFQEKVFDVSVEQTFTVIQIIIKNLWVTPFDGRSFPRHLPTNVFVPSPQTLMTTSD